MPTCALSRMTETALRVREMPPATAVTDHEPDPSRRPIPDFAVCRIQMVRHFSNRRGGSEIIRQAGTRGAVGASPRAIADRNGAPARRDPGPFCRLPLSQAYLPVGDT